ncbi:hypothetical protein DTO032I4_1572 [Paecilomyces variotii]|nr:hypothetical protein DTO032I4_1572 [Paecilomyces variotii]
MSLQDLPTEILLMCLQEFDRPDYRYRRFYALANIRLTCRRFARLVTPHLFSEITVQFSSTCLQRLEKVSQNSRIAESITQVTIALPCYDPEMLRDFYLFARTRAESIDRFVPTSCDPTTAKTYLEIEKEVDRVKSIWEAIGCEDDEIDSFDENMKLLKQSHQNYRKLYNDHQKRKREPVTLLSEILKRMKNLQQFAIDDSVRQMGRIDGKGDLILAWESGYMPAAMWSGSDFDASIGTPWKMISDIFYAMEMSSVHPARFFLDLKQAALNYKAFQMSPERLRISDILRDTKSIRILVETKTCDFCDAGFMGRLTKAMCDVASLQELEVSFSFPRHVRHTAASFLPLGKTTWAHLKSLKLWRMLFTREEFQMLLKQCNKDVLEDVHVIVRPLVLEDVSEDLKGFTKLREIEWRDH